MSIRILIADDQDLIRGALAALLGLEEDLEIVAQTGRGDEVAALVAEHDVDVALLDIEMPGRNGIDVAAELTSSGSSCRALIVTTFGRPGYLRRAMAAGARGFVVKDTPAEELAKTIREVAAGRRVVDPVLAAESMGVGESPLSPREAEVLAAAADGASVREVASRVHLSAGTVRNHLSAAIGKTGAGNRAEAARIARDRGWLLDT
ncbi:response regulator transcription factor [Gulosibacter sp. ACHW.36C]|uniref:Response regulator transcription factor n=1 Tax=Gulosibacter sediminis TaxID=1729695 RepID=A0ABY4MYM9_9MICO|nr:response regulator transcription factor [Gulosibacter sediminis]UQN15541.1 response regulator transcription factor [Gulosibacter sediminis]